MINMRKIIDGLTNYQRWYNRHRDQIRARAKPRAARYYEENKTMVLARSKMSYELDKKRFNRNAKAYRERLRNAALDRLGPVCVRCGITDRRVLTFNHRNGGGLKERKTSNNRLKLLRSIISGARSDIEVRCWNCNFLHAIEHGLMGRKFVDGEIALNDFETPKGEL